ncbi:MAG TPA: hypothetical protein PK512_06005 [bacterium]|nr:hypothetical protein [bacterium]HPO82474.1 hypothetical protein [bacterium]HRR91587.1 hypothetical protein [bacterium]
MNTKKLTPAAIRKLGIEAITKELGPVGMIRFFQQYELGYGDYTKEREFILQGEDIESIVEKIKERRKED